ncbi:MAG: glycerol-3-phosphate 1-O-acyltransferase PlsY [Candidatus Omnitrophica bacterium]|nr:glycerol-3-phosphate 1-O-acyltransferase PlsY [Candidatus Omnitrophota bacterium]
MEKIFYFILSYLIGSIPFGYLLCKTVKGIDIRKYGSGNIGATNVYRVCGWKLGFPVLIFDILKGFFPVFLGKILKYSIPLIFVGGLFSIVGHSFSIFLKGKGGKGVATSFGVLVGFLPLPALFSFLIWLIVVLTTRFVSLGSILGSFFLPIFVIYFYTDNRFLFSISVLIFVFIIFTHRENIKRLLKRKENRITLPWEKK